MLIFRSPSPPTRSTRGDRCCSPHLPDEAPYVAWSASGDVEFGVHAGAVVAGVVADQLVAAGGQSQRGPSGRSRHDAVSIAGGAAGGRLPEAARLVDLAVGPGRALSDALSLTKVAPARMSAARCGPLTANGNTVRTRKISATATASPSVVPEGLRRACGGAALLGVAGLAALFLGSARLSLAPDAFTGGWNGPAAALSPVEAVLAVGASVWLLGAAQRHLAGPAGPRSPGPWVGPAMPPSCCRAPCSSVWRWPCVRFRPLQAGRRSRSG